VELVSGPRIIAFGEGMIEVAGGFGAGLLGYGGDVLNVAIALARMGLEPAFLTTVGTDAWSDELVAAWASEGVDTTLIARHPTRHPGLYAIRTDCDGERTFTYWRESSAARAFFALPEAESLLERAAAADLLYISGITLSIYDRPERLRIGRMARSVRARGGVVAFDSNYRPRGWASRQAALDAFAEFAPCVDIALPTEADEQLLFGGEEDARSITARWHSAGAREVVVKLGAGGADVSCEGCMLHVPVETTITPLDTTGAGDAFNAGYIAARLAPCAAPEAARFAHSLAGITIRYRGALPPRDAVTHLRPEGPPRKT
jgi:2-dehydro-3-deoxygluconokinase